MPILLYPHFIDVSLFTEKRYLTTKPQTPYNTPSHRERSADIPITPCLHTFTSDAPMQTPLMQRTWSERASAHVPVSLRAFGKGAPRHSCSERALCERDRCVVRCSANCTASSYAWHVKSRFVVVWRMQRAVCARLASRSLSASVGVRTCLKLPTHYACVVFRRLRHAQCPYSPPFQPSYFVKTGISPSVM